MDLFLAICQGIGLALAAGVGGLLVPLLGSILAHLELGWDLDGTGWEWVGSEWMIAALFALNVLAFYLRRHPAARPIVLVALIAWGAAAFAASLAAEGEVAWPGLIVGALVAGFAATLTADVLAGAVHRAAAAGGADTAAAEARAPAEGAAGPVVLYAAAAGLVLCAASLLVPPISLPAIAALGVLALGRRRRAAQKYGGLRILR